MSGHRYVDTGDRWFSLPILLDACTPQTAGCTHFGDIRFLAEDPPEVAVAVVVGHTDQPPERCFGRRSGLTGIPWVRATVQEHDLEHAAAAGPVRDEITTAEKALTGAYPGIRPGGGFDLAAATAGADRDPLGDILRAYRSLLEGR